MPGFADPDYVSRPFLAAWLALTTRQPCAAILINPLDPNFEPTLASLGFAPADVLAWTDFVNAQAGDPAAFGFSMDACKAWTTALAALAARRPAAPPGTPPLTPGRCPSDHELQNIGHNRPDEA